MLDRVEHKHLLIIVIVLFILSRLMFLGFTHYGQDYKYERQGYLGWDIDGEDNRLIWVWGNFDGRHYTDIAKYGYQKFNFAFFPLYPVLLDAVHSSGLLNYLESGMFISLVFIVLSIILFYKVSLLDTDRNGAVRAIIYLLIFPLSFYYHSVYPDSLFFFLIMGSMYYARKGSWIASGLFGFFATFARISGVVLIPALIVEWMIQNKIQISIHRRMFIKILKPKLIIATGLTFFGVVVYAVYLQIFHNDFLLFQKSMSDWQQDKFIFPLIVLYRYLKIFLVADPHRLSYWISLTEFVSFIVYMLLSVYVSIRIRISYGVLMFGMILIVSFTGTLAGTPRYLLHLFPAFLGLSYIFSTKSRIALLVVAFVVLGFIYTTLFTRGHFIG